MAHFQLLVSVEFTRQKMHKKNLMLVLHWFKYTQALSRKVLLSLATSLATFTSLPSLSVIRNAVISEDVIGLPSLIEDCDAVLVNNSVDMCESHFRRKASYAVYF